MLIFGTRTLGYLCLQYVMLSGTGAVLNSPDGMGMQVVKLLLLCWCHRLRSSTGQSSGHGDGWSIIGFPVSSLWSKSLFPLCSMTAVVDHSCASRSCFSTCMKLIRNQSALRCKSWTQLDKARDCHHCSAFQAWIPKAMGVPSAVSTTTAMGAGMCWSWGGWISSFVVISHYLCQLKLSPECLWPYFQGC